MKNNLLGYENVDLGRRYNKTITSGDPRQERFTAACEADVDKKASKVLYV